MVGKRTGERNGQTDTERQKKRSIFIKNMMKEIIRSFATRVT